MQKLNLEIKARCTDPEKIRSALRAEGARFIGVDHQTDTYFKTAQGRLKLREGNIERSLIYYARPEVQDIKRSEVVLYHPAGSADALRLTLQQALGVDVVVQKRREIYFIDNVKFHIDEVKGLGTFVEIEAIRSEAHTTEDDLRKQCRHYMDLLGIEEAALIDRSYSDMIRSLGEGNSR